MAIVFPNAAIENRWNGALAARLKRAPLEAFLRSRGLTLARAGAARDMDDIARATILLLEGGLAHYAMGQPTREASQRLDAVGHAVCVVSRSLADLICKPQGWRIAALVSAAQLLCKHMSLHESALKSATCVRRFQKLAHSSPRDEQLARTVSAAVAQDSSDIAEVSAAISDMLQGFEQPNPPVVGLRERHALP